MQNKKKKATEEEKAPSPASPEAAGARGAAHGATWEVLADTVESTGDDGGAKPGQLAKGTDERDESATRDAVAATIAVEGSEEASSVSIDGNKPAAPTPSVQPGSHLGRLEIGETLGSGAFGVVVAAYDPELKRKLAVKILRPEVFDSAGGKDAQKRLLREARAMARITHPNVVTVHDIGMVDEQVFVAMEFVAGTHLQAWLTLKERSWQEILEIFSQAGRGLWAAHQEGLVHRDFKPENVLVSNKGVVRVADFGLVSISSQKKENVASSEFAVPRAMSAELGITRVGAVMGTAHYMAPEQHRGHEAGPSADQFAFCTALYGALYSRLPFEGKSYKELRENVLEGNVLAPPSKSRQPKWLWPILAKGLSTDPASRHASMEELLDSLTSDPAKIRKSRIRYGVLALAGAGVVGAFFATRSAAGSVCQNVEDRLEGTWDAAARKRIEAAYSHAGRVDGFSRLDNAVREYTENWVSARTRVCEATHLVGDQSESLMDLRMGCLDQRLAYLGELMGQISKGTKGPMLDKAVSATLKLPSIDSCTQSQGPSQKMPPPDDAEARRAIADMRGHVHKAQALFDLGNATEAVDILRGALKKPVEFPPVMGDAMHLMGTSLIDIGELDEGESMLNKSIEFSTIAGDDLAVADSWLALMHLAGVEREDYGSGYEMGRMARLAMARGKADPLTLAGADRATALILVREGKANEAIALLQPALAVYEKFAKESELALFFSALADAKAGDAQFEEAIVDYKLSLAHLESALGPEHLENVYVLNNLAVALKYTGAISEGRKALERSLRIVEKTHGTVHRSVVTILNNLGNFARREGDMEGAKEIFERSLEVGKQVYEEGHPTVSKSITNLGILLASEGDYEGATQRFREALERAETSFDGDHPDLAMALNNVGESLALENKLDEALTYAVLAMDMKARIYGEGHPKGANSIATVGSIHAQLGNVAEAERFLEQALRIFVEAAGEQHPHSIKMLSELGKLHTVNKSSKKAIEFLERAIAARGDSKTIEQGSDRLRLAQALWATSDRKEAAAEEVRVMQLIEELDDGAPLHAELKQWRKNR